MTIPNDGPTLHSWINTLLLLLEELGMTPVTRCDVFHSASILISID